MTVYIPFGIENLEQSFENAKFKGPWHGVKFVHLVLKLSDREIRSFSFASGM